MAKKGILYLLPTTLGDSGVNHVIPTGTKEVIDNCEYYIVENVRSARRYLGKLGIKRPINELTFYIVDKRTSSEELDGYMEHLLQGHNTSVISEAGCPGIADPGADVVKLAHHYQIKVVPLVGPSSILLALIASGFNGQEFAFNGYLPKDRGLRIKKIRELEAKAKSTGQTQIFMETPYRNMAILEDILASCADATHLCIAANLTTPTEYVKSQTIKSWKKMIPNIKKQPAIFLLMA